MPIPTWSPGEVLASADVNNWFVPQVAYKSTLQNVTSSTVFVNDTALSFPVTAGAFYVFDLFLFYEGGPQGSSDMKIQFTFPAALTAAFGGDYLSTGGTAQIGGFYQQNSVLSLGTNGSGNGRAGRFNGSINVGATAGTFQLQWAQNTSNATSTTMEPGSYFLVQRVG